VCGNYGCLEQYISEPALLDEYYQQTKKHITIETFIDRYKHKDPVALKLYHDFIDYLSLIVNNISLSLNPKIIVINSKIVESIPESISSVKNKLRSQIMSLEVLTTSTYHSKKNVLGLTHVLIQKFLNVENYKVQMNNSH
jgi:predicted NBD/HSP70 family sugar kinase